MQNYRFTFKLKCKDLANHLSVHVVFTNPASHPLRLMLRSGSKDEYSAGIVIDTNDPNDPDFSTMGKIEYMYVCLKYGTTPVMKTPTKILHLAIGKYEYSVCDGYWKIPDEAVADPEAYKEKLDSGENER